MTNRNHDFAKAAQALMAELNDLDGRLTAKLGQWDAEVQQAYWRIQAEWNAAAHDMQTIVTRLVRMP
ncbi:MAG: hypothetical protein JWN00_2511 [Actinomycetia bacterium]|nr:hypothetical protein [Actinomycetes bacterium]